MTNSMLNSRKQKLIIGGVMATEEIVSIMRTTLADSLNQNDLASAK